MSHNGEQGGDGSSDNPAGAGPFTTQPGIGTLKSLDPNQNPTMPGGATTQVNPVPAGQSVHPQTLAGGLGPQQQHAQQQQAQQQQAQQQQAQQQQAQQQQQQQAQQQHAAPQHVQAAYQSRPHPGLPLTPGHAFFRMLGRAFTLTMGPQHVLPNEAAQLNYVGITNPDTQGFLVWRRSVLLVAAILMLPFVTVHAVKTLKDVTDNTPGVLSALLIVHVMINFAFVFMCGFLLTQWKNWRRQRRMLLIGWLIFFVMPFAIFLVPIRELFTTDAFVRSWANDPNLAGQALEKGRQQLGTIVGLTMMMQASMVLAPKAVSLMPGIVRAAIATKLAFPGATAPGWLIALIAPLYALLVYVVLIGPYQLTGSGWILLALGGFVGGPVWLAATGMRIARALDPMEAAMRMKRARIGYLIFASAGIAFLFVAFLQIEYFKSGWWIARMMLSIGTNVLLLTLIATDAMFLSMDKARHAAAEPGADQRHRRYQQRLEALLGNTAGGPSAPESQPGAPRAASYHDGPMQGGLQAVQRPHDSNDW